MPGLYQRDNLAQQLAQAIELAQKRRERNQSKEDARRESNVKAITGFAEALGRTYETSPSVLAKKRQELLDEIESIKAAKAHEQEVQDIYDNQVAQRLAMDDYLNRQGTINAAMDNYNKAMLSKDMEGYTLPTIPNYYEAMKRRGLY